MNEFDQRGVTPLLNFEKLGWLSEPAKARLVEARFNFIKGLAAKEQELTARGARPSEAAQAVSGLISTCAKEACLGEEFGTWLDGPERQSFLSN